MENRAKEALEDLYYKAVNNYNNTVLHYNLWCAWTENFHKSIKHIDDQLELHKSQEEVERLWEVIMSKSHNSSYAPYAPPTTPIIEHERDIVIESNPQQPQQPEQPLQPEQPQQPEQPLQRPVLHFQGLAGIVIKIFILSFFLGLSWTTFFFCVIVVVLGNSLFHILRSYYPESDLSISDRLSVLRENRIERRKIQEVIKQRLAIKSVISSMKEREPLTPEEQERLEEYQMLYDSINVNTVIFVGYEDEDPLNPQKNFTAYQYFYQLVICFFGSFHPDWYPNEALV